jgi:hypothetical protein
MSEDKRLASVSTERKKHDRKKKQSVSFEPGSKQEASRQTPNDEPHQNHFKDENQKQEAPSKFAKPSSSEKERRS